MSEEKDQKNKEVDQKSKEQPKPKEVEITQKEEIAEQVAQHKSHEKHYDEILEDSFPASDPPPRK